MIDPYMNAFLFVDMHEIIFKLEGLHGWFGRGDGRCNTYTQKYDTSIGGSRIAGKNSQLVEVKRLADLRLITTIKQH